MTRRIAHLSDLHFGAHAPHLAVALAEDVSAQRPDLVVVSGDLTQRARRGQFRLARAFLGDLGVPWVAVPGNHDLAADPMRRWFRPRRAYEAHIGREAEPHWHDDQLALLGIDTTWRLVWKGGLVSRGRLAQARAWAERHPGKVRIVVAHHPFGPRRQAHDHAPVRNAKAALREWAAAGIGVLLTGHDHGAEASFVPAKPPHVLVVQASTACSTRTRGEPNGYNILDVDPDEVRVRQRVWDGHRFEDGAASAFRLLPPDAA